MNDEKNYSSFWVPDYICEQKEMDHGIEVVRKSTLTDALKKIAELELVVFDLAEALKRVRSKKYVWADKGHECMSKKHLQSVNDCANAVLSKHSKILTKIKENALRSALDER